MRRLLAIAVLALAAAAPADAATLGNWDRAEQGVVARAGVLPKQGGGFHGERPLTPGQLAGALSKLAGHPVHVPPERITVALFHRLVVRELGLSDLARSVQQEAARAGLEPPARFGSEVVARQLGLRFDHPAQDDRLELFPTDTITRAEAAYSLARVLSGGSGSAYYAREVLDRFALPSYSDAQRSALRLAVSKIGMPYVWGGESDGTSSAYGPQAHGGYDCSGFVWRVFKLSGDPAGERIGGRTAHQMAHEIARRARVRFNEVEPADLLFFGKPRNVTHVGIALSRDFMIHSSSQGVFVGPLFEGWRRSQFVWARRVVG